LFTSSDGANAAFYDAETGGNAITQVTIPDGSSTASFWYYDEKAGDWTITASDGAPADGEAGIAAAVDELSVHPAAAVKLALSAPADITAGGARAAYTVSRYDAFGNAVTSGSLTVHLFTSSDGANAAFYDAATGGNAISQVTIPDGSASASFWYYDEKAGDWTITASDASPADGEAGVADAVDELTVGAAEAAELVLSAPADITAGGARA